MEIDPGYKGEVRNEEIKRNQEIAKSRWNRPILQVPRSWFPTLAPDYHYLVTKVVNVPESVSAFKLLPSSLEYRLAVSSIIPALLDIEKLFLADWYRKVTNHIRECRLVRSLSYQRQKDWVLRQSIHMMQDYLLLMSKRCWRIFVEDVYSPAETDPANLESDDFYARIIEVDNPLNRFVAGRVLGKKTFFDFPALHMFLFWTKDVLAGDQEAVARASYFFHEGMRFLVDLERHMLERIVKVRRGMSAGKGKSTNIKPWVVCGDVVRPPTHVKCHSRLMFIWCEY